MATTPPPAPSPDPQRATPAARAPPARNASTLPDTVSRLAQAASGPPVNARQEIRVRPGDPSAAAAVSPHVAELAEWLVSEYRETNGDQLGQLIVECSAGQPLEARLQIVFDVLRAKWSPLSMAGPAASFVPVDRKSV